MLVTDGVLKSNLKSVWTSYKICRGEMAKGIDNLKKRTETAKNINSLQRQLGYPESEFEELKD